MKKIWILLAGAAVVIAVAVWFFKAKESDTPAIAIPADATALAEVNFADLLEQADLTDEQIRQFIPDDRMRLEYTGLDFSQNIYAFSVSSGPVGVVVAVDDADMLTDYLQQEGLKNMVSSVESQQGYSWAVLNNVYLLGYDDRLAMMVGPVIPSAMAETRQQMIGMMQQDKKQSVMNQPLYQELKKDKAIIGMTATMEAFPEYYRLYENLGLPKHVDFSKLMMKASMLSEEGKIVFHTSLFTSDKELEQKMRALEDLGAQIQGDLIKQVPENTAIWMGSNVLGEKLLEVLKQVPDISLALMGMNHVMDVEQMIRGMKGDVALSLAAPSFPNITLPDMTIQAQMEDFTFMNDVDYWISSANASGGAYTFKQVDEDTYYMSVLPGLNAYLTTKDKAVLVSTSEKQIEQLQNNRFSNVLEPYAKDIEGCRLYFWVDMKTVTPILQLMLVGEESKEYNMFLKFLKKMKAVAVRSTNTTSMDLILYMNGEGKGLKQMFE